MVDFPIDLYTNRDVALQQIVELLRQGSLCLFLGAGVSQSSGEFPNWVGLVKSCASKMGYDTTPLNHDPPVDILLKTMEKIKDDMEDFEKYAALVKDQLGGDFELGYHHAQNMLLISLGALIMASKRGSITDIINYNFDDLLEWYLNLHGFKIQVVSELPFLSQDADARIFHPHGFLPKSSQYKNAKHFIFDSFSYDLNIGDKNSPWFSLCQQILMQKVAIMIGLSGEDPALKSLVAHTAEELKKTGCTRPVAFLLSRSPSLQNDLKWYYKRGIAPLCFENYDDIWIFLLKVCKEAI